MRKRPLTLTKNPLLSGPTLTERNAPGAVLPYKELLLEQIEADPNQPRQVFDPERLKELASSIKAYGILSPILVRYQPRSQRYRIVAGERRYRAATMLGLKTVPVLVQDLAEEGQSEKTLSLQLVENLQRDDLTPLERAHAIGALKDTFNLSIREIGEKLGISKSSVQRSIDILALPADLLNALKEGAAESKVLLLSRIEDEEIRASYLKDIDVLTRQRLHSEISKEVTRAANDDNISPEDRRLCDEMQQHLGLKVRISRHAQNGERGKLVLDFYSDDDLKLLFRKLVEND
jgi:ParB family chromosome partitioning protein